MYIYINQYSLFLLVIFFTGKIHVFAIKWNKNMRKSMVNPKKNTSFPGSQAAQFSRFPRMVHALAYLYILDTSTVGMAFPWKFNELASTGYHEMLNPPTPGSPNHYV